MTGESANNVPYSYWCVYPWRRLVGDSNHRNPTATIKFPSSFAGPLVDGFYRTHASCSIVLLRLSRSVLIGGPILVGSFVCYFERTKKERNGMECGIVDCGMWNVECGMWDVECGVWDVGCGMWNGMETK